MRIRGLIRALNSVRDQVRAGVPAEKADRFGHSVRTIVRQVEEICARNHVTPNHLPEPSRRAYSYLKNLDLGNLPLPREGTPAPSAKVRIRNVVSTGDRYADDFWRRVSSGNDSGTSFDFLIFDLRTSAEAIEQVCAGYDATPAALEPRSREVYAWIKFLSEPDNLRDHIQGLKLAWSALAGLELVPDPARSVTLHLIRTGNNLWRSRRLRGGYEIKVSEGFIRATPEVWSALLYCALAGKDPVVGQRVREYAASEDYSEVMIEMDAMVPSPADSRQGHYHDLDASFARVNAAYFGGSMFRPALVWNRVPTGAKFGHYCKRRDQVMLSITLDDGSVPDWVVDFVMYHELLHKELGSVLSNGRRMSHTPEFRDRERRYHRYQEAEEHLAALARKH